MLNFKKEAIFVDQSFYEVKEKDFFWRDLLETIKMHSGEIYQDKEEILTLRLYMKEMMVNKK